MAHEMHDPVTRYAYFIDWPGRADGVIRPRSPSMLWRILSLVYGR